MTSLRALDPRGARHLATIGDVSGIVSADLIGDFRLTVGRLLTAAESAALTLAAHRLQVFDLAVSLLSLRARSSRDLRLALTRRGATRDEAQAAIDRLVELRLLDDAEFARHLARSKATQAGASRRRVETDLMRRGVSPETAKRAARDAATETGLDERAAAMAVARKRVRSLQGLDKAAAKRRLYAFLARRGYPSSVAASVVGEVLGAVVTDADE